MLTLISNKEGEGVGGRVNGQVLTVAEGKIGTKGGAVRGARLESASMSESEGTLEEQALMRPGLAEVSARPQGGSHLQRADPQRIPRGYEGKEGQLGVKAMGTVEIKTGERICDRIEVTGNVVNTQVNVGGDTDVDRRHKNGVVGRVCMEAAENADSIRVV